jgi:hypothetical protein
VKILVTAGTSPVSREVVEVLLQRRAEIRGLASERPEKKRITESCRASDWRSAAPVFVEQAMQGIDKPFLPNAVVADEPTQALSAYCRDTRPGDMPSLPSLPLAGGGHPRSGAEPRSRWTYRSDASGSLINRHLRALLSAPRPTSLGSVRWEIFVLCA